MEEKRNLEELEKLLNLYRARESIINKISPQICSTIDLEKFLNAVVKEVGKMMGVDRCNLMVYKDIGTLKIDFEYLRNHLPPSLNEEIPVNRGFLLSSTYKFEPFIVNDIHIEKKHPMVKLLCERYKTRSLLIVPINFKNELLAVIGLHHSLKAHRWKNEEISFVTSLANLIAIAFKYTKMFVEKEKEVKISRMLLSIINELYESRGIDLVIKNMLDNFNEIFKSDTGCLGIFSKKENRINFNIVRERKFSLSSITLPEEICIGEIPGIGNFLKKGKSVFIYEKKGLGKEEKYLLTHLNCFGVNITPIIIGKEFYGVILLIWYDESNIPSSSECEVINSVIKQISIYFEKHRLSREIKKLQDKLKEMQFEKLIIGKDNFYKEKLKEAISSLDERGFLLLEGEKGVGKEFFGKLVHQFMSENSPFVKINCSEGSVLEKIFGYEIIEERTKIKHIPGLIETSPEATIYIERGELLDDKALLHILNSLSTGVYTFSLSGKKIRIKNKFIISAEEKMKRKIPYINYPVKKIIIPSLNERRDVIPELVRYFVKEFSRTFNKNILNIESEYISYLKGRKYTENIDELKEIVKNSIINTKNNYLTLNSIKDVDKTGELKLNIRVGTTMKEIERMVIEEFLNYFNGDKTKTAEILKIGKKTIYRKIKENN